MQTQTPNEKQKTQILQLGQRALAQLALQAKAAQIEAKQAELELMMEQAYQGDMAPLQQWLRVHGQQTNELAESQELSSEADVVQSDSITGWSDLVPYAQRRLSLLGNEPACSSNADRVDLRADNPHRQLSLPASDHCDSEEDSVVIQLPLSDATQHVTEETDVQAELEDSGQEQIQEIATADPPLVNLSELGLDLVASSSVKPVAQKGRWRGAIISAVFHLVLLVLLAVVTIESPVKNGLLALVSGGNEESTEVESFEISNDPQVEVPTESNEMSEPTSQPNLSEVLPGLSDSVSQSLSDSLSQPNPARKKSSLMSAKAGPAKNVMSFYGAESSGNSFCFVLDGSGSMRGGPWEAARQELLRSIGSLKPTQRFYIIFFNKDVLAITEPGSSTPASSPLLATPENLAHAKRWLDTLQITTGQPPMKAMEAALELECDCIYFLADGEMSDSIAKRLLDTLREKNRAMDILDGEVVMIPIHTIAYYSDRGLDIMRRIAEENRGQFAYVPKPKTARGTK